MNGVYIAIFEGSRLSRREECWLNVPQDDLFVFF